MSSSVFKDFESPERINDSFEDENLKIDPNLVILVNKEGKVSVDERTLHSLLANETTDTSVTIVRVGSPTPSMHAEMDEEDKKLTDLELLEALGEGLEENPEPPPPRVNFSVENYYPASEAKNFVAEVLSLAGIDHPNSIDFEFQRYVIQNDHCYTNLTSPVKLKPVAKKTTEKSKLSQPELERSARQRKPTTKVLESSVLEKDIFKADEVEKSNASEHEDFVNSGSDYNEETSESSEEVDHESDLDFNINQSNKAPKKGKKRKLKKQIPKKVKKVEREVVEKERVERVKQPRKSVSKGKQPPQEKLQEEVKEQPEPEPVIVVSSNNKKEEPKARPVKKAKNLHSDALLLDMSSLFSQPDKIIRHEKPSTSKGFVSLTSKEKLPGTISVQTAPPSVPHVVVVVPPSQQLQQHHPKLEPEQDKQLDLIDSIVSKELADLPDSALPDTALLDTLGDALPEDFLAELAENKELQDIIDKSFNATPVISVPEIKKIPTIIQIPAVTSIPMTATPEKQPNTQVVRPDGRVITLPPIEVPTTRAKKRKEEDPPVTPATKSTPEPVKVKARKQSSEKASSRRSSTNRSSTESRRDSTTRKRSINPAVLAVLHNDEEDDEDDFESDAASVNSEDDPNRLWCICKQPHNGRFMICCDMCEDWFHGKCVSITKAMGKQMEISGKEWTCPNCIKKKKEREQPRITTFMGGEEKNTNPSQQKSCIVCKKAARQSSIYCSDECILKHAQTATKSDTPTTSTSVMKDKNNRVFVCEKSTGRCISGDKAPTMENLKQWLKDNPTFEVVSTGSAQAKAILAKQKQLKELSKKMKTTPPVSPQSSTVQTTLKFSPGDKKLIIAKHDRKSISYPKSLTPKASTSRTSGEESKPNRKPEVKVRKISDSQKTPPSGSRNDEQLWRSKIKSSFKEQLTARMSEITDVKIPKLTEADIEKFSTDLEKELFELFNREIGNKYKAKWRTLIFNMKDRKNLTLFKKICEKSISPHRLVRMEAQELASQELTKWRENESKHSLEMIKKSELELLAASKNFVLKTHKGEEVLESKTIDRVEIDSSIAVEDVVSVLNNSSVSSSTSTAPAKDYVRAYSKDDQAKGKKDSKHRARSRSRDRHGKSSSSKHSKRRHSRERSKERKDRHHKSRKSPEKKPEKSRGELAKVPKKELSTNKTEDYNLIDKILEASQAILSTGRIDVEKIEREAAEKEKAVTEKKREEKREADSDQEPTSTVTIPTPPHVASPAESPAMPMWSGTINVNEIARFKIEARAVSGNAESIADYLPSLLEVVGRIQPEMVWDYLSKIKTSPTKEIVTIRFASTDEENYTTLYMYYVQRRRLGVVKSESSTIKDFYIVPLTAAQKIPSVLLPFKGGPGFPEGTARPNMLLGVIVKIKNNKRPSSSIAASRAKISKTEAPLLPPIITKKSLESIDPTYSKSDASLPSLKKKKKSLLSLGLPKTESLTVADDDEPYSPGGSDNDEEEETITLTTSTTSTITKTVSSEGSEEISKAFDEINRKIEARRLEIASMLGSNSEELDEPYSPGKPVTPPAGSSSNEKQSSSSLLPGLDKLENIAIPSNLSEILASIKGSTSSATTTATIAASVTGIDPNEEYDPTTTIEGSSYYQSSAKYTSTGYKAASYGATTTTTDSAGAEKMHQQEKEVMDVDNEMNEDDFFEFPDDDGVEGADEGAR